MVGRAPCRKSGPSVTQSWPADGGEPALVNDVWSDPRFQTVPRVREELQALGVQAAAMYPLDFRGELLAIFADQADKDE